MLAENLRRLRRERSLSQAHLAEKAGLSLPAYRNIETGKSLPREETLRRLATSLEVRPHELLSEVKSLSAVRFRANKKMKRRSQVLTDVAQWLESFNQLEKLVGSRTDYVFESLPAELACVKQGVERASRAAYLAREKLKLSNEDTIVDICGLLESGGVKVYPLELASDDFFGLSVAPKDGGPATIVNVWGRISVERWIFTAAHELGHLLLHLDSFDINQYIEDPDQEAEANIFASYFLMPEPLFGQHWKETYGWPLIERVLKVKRIFRVSYRTVLYRLIASYDYPRTLWQVFQVEYKRRFHKTLSQKDEPQRVNASAFQAALPEARRAHEPSQLDEWDFVGDRFRGLVREAVEGKHITLSRGAELLGLELSEMRVLAATWKGH